MANTVVGFTINIDGIQSINQLNAEIKATKEAMNALDLSTEEGNKAFQELSQTLGKMTAQQKALKKAQDDVNKSFLPEKAVGAYDQLSAKLNKLRKEFKNAALDGSKTTQELDKMQKEIQQLDKTLKQVDGQVGQFQRNVGNYPRTFSRVTRSLTQAIPGFEAFSSTLKDGEGNLSGFGKALIGGFVAFQAANLIGKAIGKIGEFIDKINETKETVASFSGASGEDLDRITASTTALSETFKTDAKTISEAAQALSQRLGIGFEEALGKLEGALVEGRGNADEYLNSISQYPETFQEATGAVTDFSERNKNLLNTNKELAESQVSVAERLQGLSDGFKNVYNIVTTTLLVGLANLIDFFKPLIQTIGILIGYWFDLGKAIASFVTSLPIVKQIFEGLAAAGTFVLDAFKAMPFIFSGIIESIKQLGRNFANFFTDLYLQAQIFGQQVKGAFGADVQDAINELRRQREQIKSEGKSIAEAYSDGYNKAKEKSDLAEQQQKKKQTAAIKKIDVEAQKEQIKAAQDAAKKLAEDRAKFQEDEIKQARQRTALLADLSAKAIEERIKNIKDGYQRELAEINNNFENQKADLQKQYDDLVIASREREQELIKTFGKNSAEVLKVQRDNAIQLQAVAQAQATILIQYEQQKNDAIAKANETQRLSEVEKAQEQVEKLKDIRDMALSSELDYIQKQGEFRELKNAETLNKLLAQEKDAKKREELIRLAAEQETIDKIANIKNQIQALNDAELMLLDETGQKRIDITQEEYDAILLERQKLFTELSDIEKKQTEDVAKNLQDQTKIRQEQFEQVLGYFQQGIELIGEAFNVANERQQAAFDADIERSQARQENLQAELENSTGLRRRFFEQQLNAEIANQAAIEKAKEEAEKRAAKKQKALSIIQSIINTALAVSRALATSGPIGAIAAGIIGAAQTALIAAQPLAEGGVVGKLGGEIVQFAEGGMVTSKGNIKPLSNGDNVLATLKTGEVVLNQDQQRRIGYSTLKAARIPNFATGGVVGAPSAFLQDSMNRVSEEQNRFKVMENLVLETQNRIDRIQVVYTASTEDEVDKARNERKEIKTTAQF